MVGALLWSGARRGPDGRTAYERRKGRAFQRKIPPFGEKILYLFPGATVRSHGPARVEPTWEDGVYLGLSDRADEVYVGLSDECRQSQDDQA